MTDVKRRCQKCDKEFLVIQQEQEFLAKKGLPLPVICPTDRQARRLASRGERKLYRTTCQQCRANMITTYDPQKVTSKILCYKCLVDYFDKTDLLVS